MGEQGYPDCIAGARSLAAFELLRQRLVREIVVAAPSAGLDWSLTVPAGVTWELLSIRARLVTSAVVATRVVALQAADGPNVVVEVAPVSTHTASLTGIYAYGQGTTGTSQTSSRLSMSTGLPEPKLREGWTVGTATSNLDVGDQWALIVVFVREWSMHAAMAAADWLEGRAR